MRQKKKEETQKVVPVEGKQYFLRKRVNMHRFYSAEFLSGTTDTDVVFLIDNKREISMSRIEFDKKYISSERIFNLD